MDERDYGIGTAKQIELSPTERLMEETDKLLAILNETVLELRNRVRPITSSALRGEDGNVTEPDVLRMGSSAIVDGLYSQQAQIKRATYSVREVINNLEV